MSNLLDFFSPNTFIPASLLAWVLFVCILIVAIFVRAIFWYRGKVGHLERKLEVVTDEAKGLSRSRDMARRELGKAHRKIEVLESTFEAMSDLALSIRHSIEDVKSPHRGGDYVCGTITGQFQWTAYGNTAHEAVKNAILQKMETKSNA